MKNLFYEYQSKIVSGDIKITFQFILKYTPISGNYYYNAEEKGIRITNISEIELSTDKENPVLFPANVTIDLIDANYEFYNNLVNGDFVDLYCKIERNNKTEFYGKIIKDVDEGYLCDKAEKEISIEFASPTNKLKEKRIVDIDGNIIYTSFIPIGRDSIQNILNNMLIDTAINPNVIIKHDWIYKGYHMDTGNQITDIKTSDLIVNLFDVVSSDRNGFNLVNYDEILKALCFSLGAYISFANYSKPIFRSLIYRNEKLVPTENQIKYIKRKRLTTKELVRITAKAQIGYSNVVINKHTYNSIENYTGSEENAFIKDVLFPIERDNNVGQLFDAKIGTNEYRVDYVRNPFTNQWTGNGEILRDTWKKIIESWNNGSVEISLIGVDFDFYNSIQVDNKEFMIESMKKNLIEHETIIEAFPI